MEEQIRTDLIHMARCYGNIEGLGKRKERRKGVNILSVMRDGGVTSLRRSARECSWKRVRAGWVWKG
jgi:hypothetical protein